MPATTSKRPYFSSSTNDLFSIFEGNSENKKILLALKAELGHRDRPRAKKLAKLVQDALDGKKRPEQLSLPVEKPRKSKKLQSLPLPGVSSEQEESVTKPEDSNAPLLRWLARFREI